MKTRGILTVVIVALLSLGAGGAGAVWYVQKQGGFGPKRPQQVQIDTRSFKYISLDKVIVMLRNGSGEPAEHYLALDLVFRTPAENEGITREQLPLLRSVAVQTLSTLTVDAASHATIESLSGQINGAYTQTYVHDRQGKPFAEAMIGKLIIE